MFQPTNEQSLEFQSVSRRSTFLVVAKIDSGPRLQLVVLTCFSCRGPTPLRFENIQRRRRTFSREIFLTRRSNSQILRVHRPDDVSSFVSISSNKRFFLADDDGSISREFGASDMPRTVILDPMLRSIADVGWDNPQGYSETVGNVLRGLPAVDDSAGVPMFAPALIVPRVFSFELCDFLVQFYEQQGGTNSGFQFDISGKTTTLSDWRLKRRSDVPVAAPEVRELVRSQVVRRLLPQIEQNFQFKATRMDRYIVACYDAEVGGHFHRHRDNVNAGAQHRRFAVSINLNNNFEGCDLMFPEFCRRTYRPPEGGALVFSCGALHQVTPVTKGRRYAFLAFLYGEEDAKKREVNNARLHAGEQQYIAGRDRLFPEAAPEENLVAVA